jgi:hypothetical protein
MDEKWSRAYGTVLGALIGSAMGSVIAGSMVATGEWTVYAHEYAVGVRFAPDTEAGCGVELPTRRGREAGLTLGYCDAGNGWDWLPEAVYTVYGE